MSDIKDDDLETSLDDEFNFDDDLDFGVDDFPMGDVTDDRTPVTKVKDIARKSLVQSVASPAAARDVLSKVLPDSYTSAGSKLSEARDFVDSARDVIYDEIGPLTDNVKKIAAASHKKISGLLPKSINAKIEALTAARETSDSGGSYKEADAEERRSQQAADLVANLLRGQAELEEERRASDRTEEYAKDAIESKRHRSEMEVSYRTALGVDKLVSFNEQFITKIHSKSLEIQLKQYMLLSDFANTSAESGSKMLELLANINKNSALPDIQKQQVTESLKSTSRQALAQSAINRLSEFTSGWMDEFKSNLQKTIKGYTGQVEMIASMSDMMSGMDMGGFGEDPDAESARTIGGMIRSQAMRRASGVHDRLMNNETYANIINRVTGSDRYKHIVGGVQRGDTILQSAMSDIGGDLVRGRDYMANSSNPILRLIGNIMPDINKGRDALNQDAMDSLHQAAVFDNKVYRSITEAIPGHLSSIDRWMQMLVTNQYVAPGDAVVYDYGRGGFTTHATRESGIRKTLVGVFGGGAVKSNIDAFSKDSLGYELTADNQHAAAIRDIIMAQIETGRPFDPQEFITRVEVNKTLPPEEKKRLTDSISNKYRLDDQELWGSAMDRAPVDYGEYSEFMLGDDASMMDKLKARKERAKIDAQRMRENAERTARQVEVLAKDRKAFARLKDQVKTGPGAVNILADTYGLDTLRDMSLIDTTDQGVSRINLEALSSFAANTDRDSPATTQPVVIPTRYEDLPRLQAPVQRDDAELLRSIVPALRELQQPPVDLDDITMQVYELTSHAEDSNTWLEYHAELLEGITATLRNQSIDPKVYKGLSGLAREIRESKPVTLTSHIDALQSSVADSGRVMMRLDKIQEQLKAPTGDIEWRDRQLDLLDLIKQSNVRQEELIAACCETTNANLLGILEVSGANVTASGGGNWSPGKLLGSVYGKIRNPVVSAVSKYLGFWANAYSTAGKGVWEAAKWGGEQISKVTTRLADTISNTADIYVKGELTPRIRGVDIESGRYYDIETDSTILSIDDITGPVHDMLKDREVLSEDDFERGLTNNRGMSILYNVGRVGKAYLGIYKGLFNAGGTVLSKALDAATWVKDKIVASADGFLPGEESPRILGRLLDRGDYYYCTVSKRLISSYEEIKGDLLDPEGRLVLTLDELRKSDGLFNRWGSKINFNRSAVDKVIGLVGAGARAYGSYVKGLYNFGKGVVVGAWSKVKNLFSSNVNLTGDNQTDLLAVGHAQLTVQEKIYNLLLEVNQDKLNRSLWDKDGSGRRDGHWRDQLTDDDDEIEETDKDDSGQSRVERGDAAWGAAAGALGGAGEWLGDRAGDALDIWDRIRGRRRRPGARRRARRMRGASAGKRGLIRRIAGGAVRGGAAALPFLGKAAVATGGLLKTIALGAVGVIGIKALVVGAVVGGLAYGGYKMFKHFTRDRNPIVELRLTQYGVKPTSEDAVNAVLRLEALCSRATNYSEADGASINVDKINIQEVARAVGIELDPTNEEKTAEALRPLLEWFSKRFQPVYVTWETARRRHAKDIAIADLDAKLKNSVALAILEEVEMRNHEAFDVNVNPSKVIKITRDAGDVRSAHKYAVKHFTKLLKDNPEPEEDKEVAVVVPGAGKDAEEGKSTKTIASRALTAASVAIPGIGLVRKLLPKGEADPDKKPSKVRSYLKHLTMAMLPAVAVVKYRLDANAAKKAAAIANKQSLINIRPLTAVRYTAYGLSKLDEAKVRALRALEQWAFDRMSYAGPVATLNADSQEALREFGSKFASSERSDDFEARWVEWFVERFVPVAITYATAVRADGRFAPTNADVGLQHEDALEVAEVLVTATSTDKGVPVWQIMISPWDNYVLSAGADEVALYLEILKQSILERTSRVEGEEKAKADKKKRDESDKRTMFQRITDITMAPGRLAMRAVTTPIRIARNVMQGGSGPVADTPFVDTSGGSNIQHPGGGTGGDINDLPIPRGDGLDNNKDLIISAAGMVGVDPGLAMTMAQLESNYVSSARPGTSRAQGLYQIVPATWRDLVKKYGHRFGIASNTPVTDPRANTLMGLSYIKENADGLLETFPNRKLSHLDLYLAHFLGLNGARRFLKANDNEPVSKHVSSAAWNANQPVFRQYLGRNKLGKELSVGGVKQQLMTRVTKAVEGHSRYTAGLGGPAQEVAASIGIDTVDTNAVMTPESNVADTGTVEQAQWISHTVQDGGLIMPAAPTAPDVGDVNLSIDKPVAREMTPTEAHIVQQNTPREAANNAVFTPAALRSVPAPIREASTLQETHTPTGESIVTPEPPRASERAKQADRAAPTNITVDMSTTNAILNNQLNVLTSIDGKMSTMIKSLDRPLVDTTVVSAPTPHTTPPRVARPLDRNDPTVVSSTARNKRHTYAAGRN